MVAPRAMYLVVPPDAAEVLRDLAHHEYRRPNDQATVLVLEALRARGLLSQESPARRPLVTAGGPETAA
jgi:hypothetical protein